MGRRVFRRGALVCALAALALFAGAAQGAAQGTAGAQAEAPTLQKILVFSKTVGFRHGSIGAGIQAYKELGAANGFTVDTTEDSAAFTDANLEQYDAVVFLSTTGDVLNNEQQNAFERYIKAGNGYVGVHAAADTEYTWPWYGEMLGAYFRNHPAETTATVRIEDADEPSTATVPQTWVRRDEWYNWQPPTFPLVNGNQGGPNHSPRSSGVKVLATVDESTYDENDDRPTADDHPVVWCSDFDGGRSWYTAMGHSDSAFSEPDFREMLLGGLQTVTRTATADCGQPRKASPSATDFEVRTLARGADKTGEPIAMAVLPDRRVLHTSRDGRVWLTTPNATTSLAGTIPVYSHDEDGLQGIAVDPNFATNRWVYVYYAPPLSTPSGDAPNDAAGPAAFEPFKGHNQLSRMKLTDAGTLDRSTEQKILQVPADRGICCHAGGEIDFDAQGNLFLSTGDDSNPFQSDGYSPLDERLTRNPAYDAQRSAGNTNDLRGKLLRIKVAADGSYTSPAGNLFAPGQMGTRPEVYAMGFRNPFRFAVDDETGWVYLGDYGPDAGGPNANRGPSGQVEYNLIKGPGNYGWPYCHGKNAAYNDYDFATKTSGAKFDCAAPKNTSPRNTGLVDLPPAQPAWIAYDGCSVREFGCGSESPMGGPTYNYDADNPSTTKFPQYFDGKNFAYEFGRAWIRPITVGQDGALQRIEPFLESVDFKQLISVEFGPDGSLYVLDYGSSFFQGDANSAVYRIDYVQGTRTPTVEIDTDKSSGPTPLTVNFSSEGSRDPDGTAITYAWDFDGNGTTDSTAANPSHTYSTVGRYTATLAVTDAGGQVGRSSVNIVVGNSAPKLTIELPANGAIFEYGDTISYRVKVTDAEDGSIDCSKVRVDTALGHNTHSHGDQSLTGCSGQFTIPAAWEDKTQHSVYVVTASYTDKGVSMPGLELSGSEQVVLEHRTQQAEFYDGQEGAQVVSSAGAAGGKRVGYIDGGDWLRFDDINLGGIDSVQARVSAAGASSFQLRVDSTSGPVVATVPVASTGGYDTYQTQAAAPITDPGGTHDLYVVFDRGGMDLDEFTFLGAGANGNNAPVLEANATPTSGSAPVKVQFTASATDPEGKAVSYEWDFGVAGAPKATTANASYTYTTSGRYTATVTATDADGRKSVRSFAIQALSRCITTDTDSFDGTTLDRTRWSRILREDASGYRVEDGALVIDAADGDMYGGNTRAENIIGQPAPTGPWTATTKVTLAPAKDYEQAAMILHASDQQFLKLAYIRTGPDRRNVEFMRQRDGKFDDQGAVDRSANFPAGAPNTVYLQMRSDGTTVTAAWSADGQTWTPVGRQQGLDGLDDALIGISAFNGLGTPASFDTFSLTGAGSAAGPDDEFDGTALDVCRWATILREDPAHFRVTGGKLEIDAVEGDMFGSTDAKNLILQDAPSGSWEATTKVTLPQGEDFEQAGLILHSSDREFAKLMLIDTGGADGWRVELGQNIDGKPVFDSAMDRSGALPAGTNTSGVYLRLTSNGSALTGAWSTDGKTWTAVGRSRSLATMPNPKIGLTAFNGNGQKATFDFFHLKNDIQADTTAPSTTATTSPAQPDGTGGWFTRAVELRLATEAGATTEYRVGGGAFQAYSGMVSLGNDGTHVVTYRSKDAAGNVESEQTVTVKVDRTKPTSTATMDPAQPGPSGSYTGPVGVTLAGGDAAGGAGLDLVQYRLDGGEWRTYDGRVTVSERGSHTLEHRATDKAGNVGTIGRQTFSIQGQPTGGANTAPKVKANVDRPAGNAPHAVRFSASGSDADGSAAELTYVWDFGDGSPVVRSREAEHTFREPGNYEVKVTVTDADGATGTDSVRVTATRAPVDAPPNGGPPAGPPTNTPPVTRPPAGKVVVTPRISRRSVRVSRSGRANIRLRCPASAGSSCKGILTMTRGTGRIRMDHGRLLSRRSFTMRADRFGTVSLRLSKDGFARLKKARKLGVTVVLFTRGADGELRRVAERLTLRAPKR